ncbi:hypothetical protein NQ317_015795 [Molorchus minor]|uniref:C2H2-type domain-containing protein n=1 Tax=Molorchus minor TaxID=1323400 RepID=A0ABQ9J1Q9_9CUCU|nr:hypothetical protein NQ317_015795 [Molorchus minor]
MCKNCAELIRRAFTFKTTCISTEEIILSHAVAKDATSFDMRWVYHEEKACEEGNYTCLESVKASAKGLPEYTLEHFLPEIDFDIVRPVVCKTCEELLTKYFKFTSTSHNIEEQINKYSKQEGTNSNVKAAAYIKETVSHDDDGDFEETDVEMEEIRTVVDLPNELEHSLEYLRHQNDLENDDITPNRYPNSHVSVNENGKDVKTYQCKICSFTATRKAALAKHCLNHSSSETFKCDICELQTDFNYYSKEHARIHKVKNMYKCNKCEIMTHSLRHMKASEVTMYKCCKCEYKTKDQSNFKKHGLVHKKASEVTMYKCCKCEFKTKYRSSLRKHNLTHQVFSKVTMYECEICKFKTSCKKTITRHGYVHKHKANIETYKCETGGFTARHRGIVARHSLVHKTALEAAQFQDSEMSDSLAHGSASEVARLQDSVQRNPLSDNDIADVETDKCVTCGFPIKCKEILKCRGLETFKCDFCDFETKHYNFIMGHLWTHKNTCGVKMYRCYICNFKSKTVNNLRQHVVAHKTASEVAQHQYSRKCNNSLISDDFSLKTYQCETCGFTAKRKAVFARHSLVHRASSEVSEDEDGLQCTSLVENDIADVETYQFDKTASEVTQHQDSLQCESPSDKDVADIETYGSDTCEFISEREKSDSLVMKTTSEVAQHQFGHQGNSLVEKAISDVETYKCETCEFHIKCKEILKTRGFGNV